MPDTGRIEQPGRLLSRRHLYSRGNRYWPIRATRRISFLLFPYFFPFLLVIGFVQLGYFHTYTSISFQLCSSFLRSSLIVISTLSSFVSCFLSFFLNIIRRNRRLDRNIIARLTRILDESWMRSIILTPPIFSFQINTENIYFFKYHRKITRPLFINIRSNDNNQRSSKYIVHRLTILFLFFLPTE